jgi:hypothetical protein
VNENKITREWLEARGLILTEEQDRQLWAWLEQNRAHMVGSVSRNYFEVLIYRPLTALTGVGESRESLSEAVRLAQLDFDVRDISARRRRARVVGQA